MPFADVNDIHMYFEDGGSGVPVIFLHGATESIDFGGWNGMRELFQPLYRSIYIEHRGHGRTNNPRDYLT
jgi:pimeloyl-ACP methyl ester carboxylesterase